jgi:hypothetical protein
MRSRVRPWTNVRRNGKSYRRRDLEARLGWKGCGDKIQHAGGLLKPKKRSKRPKTAVAKVKTRLLLRHRDTRRWACCPSKDQKGAEQSPKLKNGVESGCD